MQKDVHTEHCCVRHGCKYGDQHCTVITGVKQQSFPCELCEDEDLDKPEKMEKPPRLSDYSDDDLKKELKRREIEKNKQANEVNNEAKRLTLEHVDTLLLFTSHSRTSCSDDNLMNVYEGCPRCQLLTIKSWSYNSEYVASVQVKTIPLLPVDN